MAIPFIYVKMHALTLRPGREGPALQIIYILIQFIDSPSVMTNAVTELLAEFPYSFTHF